MGRPRKDSQIVDAKQRLIDSLWRLLEERRLHEVTVGMVSIDAKCNRGTFYYHYEDMDQLVKRAVELEFLAPSATLNKLFGTMAAAEDHSLIEEASNSREVKRIALLIEQGGFDVAFASAIDFVLRLWKRILCAEGEEITPEARVIIEYAVCGLFGMFTSSIRTRQETASSFVPKTDPMTNFALENSRFVFAQICKAQGVSQEEAAARLRMSEDFIQDIQKETSQAKK